MSMSPHVPSPSTQCALARKEGPGGLALQARGLRGPSAPPEQEEIWRAAGPPSDGHEYAKWILCRVPGGCRPVVPLPHMVWKSIFEHVGMR